MKNVKEYQMQNCIVKTFDEFQKDVTEAMGNVKVGYEWSVDTVFFNNGETDIDIDEVARAMSEHYDVRVHNFFLTGVEQTFIWVVYSESHEVKACIM